MGTNSGAGFEPGQSR